MHLSLKGHKHGIKQMDEPVTFKNINTLITVTTTTARATCGIKAIPGVYDGGKDRISHWKQEILFSSLNIFYCVTAGWTLLTMLVIIINWWLLLELRNTQQTPESPKKKNLKKEPRNHWTQPDFRYGRSDPCLTPELLHWRQWDFISVKAVSEDGDQNYPDSPYFYSVSGSQSQSSEIFGCSHEPFAALASRWHGAYCGLHTSCWRQFTPTTLPGIQSREKGKRLYLQVNRQPVPGHCWSFCFTEQAWTSPKQSSCTVHTAYLWRVQLSGPASWASWPSTEGQKCSPWFP